MVAVVAEPMPSYSYVCTVSQPMRENVSYLPSDGMCDYIFYDSLYKDGKDNLLSGIGALEHGAQYFIGQAPKYRNTQFGFSFAPESHLLTADFKDTRFNSAIDAIWNSRISHFGFLDLYRQYTELGHVTEALTVLKTVYLHIKSKAAVSRPSYYVVGMSLDSSVNTQLLNLMKTVFTPSMFISIAHLSYSVRTFEDCRIFPVAMHSQPQDLSRGTDYTYGHTVNDSMAVLRNVHKMGFSMPLAISFSLKGIYYSPKLSDPSSPSVDEFQLFRPCEDFSTTNYDDPKVVSTAKLLSAFA
ncbi:hypothetical protein MTO96_045963 [Rhipicephalus appendiculatus]